MTTIDLSTVRNLYQANVLYELHNAAEKIRLYEIKYGVDFTAFEERVKSTDRESFNEWDDYIEWKAYIDSYNYYLSAKEDLENGNIKVA